MKPTDEANKLVAIAAIFVTMPRDARFRTLAFLTASTLKVAHDPISDALYAEARMARETRRRKPRAKRRVSEGGGGDA